MTDEEIAEIFAAQTVILAMIIEELSDRDVLYRQRFISRLYNALEVMGDAFGKERKSAPIRHLLNILENDTIREELDWD